MQNTINDAFTSRLNAGVLSFKTQSCHDNANLSFHWLFASATVISSVCREQSRAANMRVALTFLSSGHRNASAASFALTP